MDVLCSKTHCTFLGPTLFFVISPFTQKLTHKPWPIATITTLSPVCEQPCPSCRHPPHHCRRRRFSVASACVVAIGRHRPLCRRCHHPPSFSLSPLPSALPPSSVPSLMPTGVLFLPQQRYPFAAMVALAAAWRRRRQLGAGSNSLAAEKAVGRRQRRCSSSICVAVAGVQRQGSRGSSGAAAALARLWR